MMRLFPWVSHPNAGNSIRTGTLATYSVRAGRPRSLTMEHKNLLDLVMKEKTHERPADFNELRETVLTFYDHL